MIVAVLVEWEFNETINEYRRIGILTILAKFNLSCEKWHIGFQKQRHFFVTILAKVDLSCEK